MREYSTATPPSSPDSQNIGDQPSSQKLTNRTKAENNSANQNNGNIQRTVSSQKTVTTTVSHSNKTSLSNNGDFPSLPHLDEQGLPENVTLTNMDDMIAQHTARVTGRSYSAVLESQGSVKQRHQRTDL